MNKKIAAPSLLLSLVVLKGSLWWVIKGLLCPVIKGSLLLDRLGLVFYNGT
jgi:hypothetical protein